MKTPETAFGFMPSIDANLFSVRAGIPLATVAEEAACIVDAAGETVRRVACMISAGDGAHLLWSAVYALTMANGLIEAVQAALEDLEDAAPPANPEPAPHVDNPFAWSTDLYLTPVEHQRLAEIAERDYRGDLAAAASGLLGRAVREHAARVVGGAA